jgi:hypothetical protein
MTKPKRGGANAPAELPRPRTGGSFILDPKTGALTREAVVEPETDNAPPPAGAQTEDS